MSRNGRAATTRGHGAVSAVLFLSLFAPQAGLIAVTPVLADLARDLDVSTAVAGQLRTITGLVAAVTALVAGGATRRVGLGRLLMAASLLLALGSLASAAAPSFELLALAQVPVGTAVGIFTTAGLLAAAEWVPAASRTRVLSWALVGQPAAWLVGMPVVGVLGAESWRYGWLALPFAAALLTGAAVAHRASEPPVEGRPARLRTALDCPEVARWLGAEALSNTAWAGTIVYAGALFVEVHGASASTAGVALAIGAASYVVGNRSARGLAARASLHVLVALGPMLGLAIIAFGAVRQSLVLSVALFAVAGLVAGGRTLVSSAYGLAVRPDLRPAVVGGRAATMQLGYFAGSSLGGGAILAGGYTALGLTLGALVVAGAAVLAASHARSFTSTPTDVHGACVV